MAKVKKTLIMMVSVVAIVCLAMSVSAWEGPMVFSRRDGIIYLIAEKGLTAVDVAMGLDPDIGPDGRSIVYVTEEIASDGAESSFIWIKNLENMSVRSVLKGGGRIRLPEWSPDGSEIAFLMFDSEYFWSIHVVRPDGTGFRRVAGSKPGGEGPVLSGSVNWWPDGKSLIAQDGLFVYRFGLDGNLMEKTPVEKFTGDKYATTSTDRFLPHPEREGLWAFTMSVPGTPLFEKTFNEPNQALFIIDMASGEKKRLTPEDMLAMDINWSPDGKMIFFSGYRDANMNESYPFRIYSLDVETGEITEVCPGEQPGL